MKLCFKINELKMAKLDFLVKFDFTLNNVFSVFLMIFKICDKNVYKLQFSFK
jgi:hypothetical protein